MHEELAKPKIRTLDYAPGRKATLHINWWYILVISTVATAFAWVGFLWARGNASDFGTVTDIDRYRDVVAELALHEGFDFRQGGQRGRGETAEVCEDDVEPARTLGTLLFLVDRGVVQREARQSQARGSYAGVICASVR